MIKSPMNYVGGKYKLLPQILPLFPENIETFVDLFCGGLNVGINVEAKNIVANDICLPVIEVYKGIQKEGMPNALNKVKDTIKEFGLSKTNEEGFKAIRDFYNKGNKEWYIFYSMLTHAFNYQIRFNKNGEYNMPFGKNRSSFNPNLEKNFIEFSNAISDKNITFCSSDFKKLKLDCLTNKDFIYLDPPYLLGCASYNESDGWNETQERELLNLCDMADKSNIKFGISNVLMHKGKSNDILIEWSKKFNIYYLDKDYNNCNYQDIARKNNKTVEVFICNY